MSNISVVIPVFNGEAFIKRTIAEIKNFHKNNSDVSFIIVNDGSTDDTGSIIKSDLKSADGVELIEYSKNQGKAHAVKLGALRAESEFICFTDADLAYSLDHIKILVDKLKSCDVAIGNRYLHNNNIPFARRAASEIFNRLTRVLLGFSFADTQAGIKGFRKKVAKELFSRQTIKSFAFDIELIFIARKKGFVVAEIAAKLKDDHHKDPSTINLISDSLKMTKDVIRIKINDIMGRYGKGETENPA